MYQWMIKYLNYTWHKDKCILEIELIFVLVLFNNNLFQSQETRPLFSI